MAERDSIQRPAQIFLDTWRFIHPPAPHTRGPSKDFFQGPIAQLKRTPNGLAILKPSKRFYQPML